MKAAGGESTNSSQVTAIPVGPAYAAQFVSQSVPAAMAAGQSYAVSVTMKNTGTNTWTNAGNYHLVSQNPQQNTTWGFNRVSLPTGAAVTPGQNVTFAFTVTAPSVPGVYDFQWGLIQEGVEWFGDLTPNVPVSVFSPPAAPIGLSILPGNGQLTLSWPPVIGATTYTVYRSTTSGGPYTVIGSGGSTTTYTDNSVTNGTPYYYVVTAVNVAGESPFSDEGMGCPLAPASASTATPAYGYDGDGLRAWKQPPGGARTYFLYDGDSPVCEMDASGNVTAVNTFGPTGLLSRHTTTGGSTFYAFDPQGNVSVRMDGSGNVLGSYVFDAFGARVGTDSTTDPFAGFGGQWGYYSDPETGLQLLTHRYYDSGAGRFVTRDLGYVGGVNLYSYNANNPVNDLDPNGTFDVSKLYWGGDRPRSRPAPTACGARLCQRQ